MNNNIKKKIISTTLLFAMMGLILQETCIEAVMPAGLETEQTEYDSNTTNVFTFMKDINIQVKDGKQIKVGDAVMINLLTEQITDELIKSRGIEEVYYDCLVIDRDYQSYGTEEYAMIKFFRLPSDEKCIVFNPKHPGTYQIIWREYQSKNKDGEAITSTDNNIIIVNKSVNINVADNDSKIGKISCPPDGDNNEPALSDIKLSSVKVKVGTKKITGRISESNATVKVKVGNKSYANATVKGKKFTAKVSKLKKGTKITIKVSKKGYNSIKKKYNVK